MKISISNRIQLRLRDIPKKLLGRIKSDLSFDNPDYQYAERTGNIRAMHAIPQFVLGYSIDNGKLYVDRAYNDTLIKYLKHLKIKYDIEYLYNELPTLVFDDVPPIALRAYQKRAARKMLQHNDGVMVMPCGSGKTRVLLEMIRRLKQNTLVLVHTTDLLNQWKDYIKQHFDLECGIIQGDKTIIAPITVAMVQTLYNRELTDTFKNLWGCVVLDEAHHAPADTFTSVMNAFPAKYRYGATATVNRSDKLEGILFSVCGFPRIRVTYDELEQGGYIIKPTVRLVTTNYYPLRVTSNYHKAVGYLIRNKKRLRLVLDTIFANREHYNLVLSNRVEHLEKMYKLYAQRDERCALLIGRVKQDERNDIIRRTRSGELHTIFATQLADEGLDIPILDRLYLTVSTKAFGRIEQRLGRVQRRFQGKSDAIVYDYDDSNIPMFSRHVYERIRLYRNLGLNVVGGRNEFRPSSNQTIQFRIKNEKVTGYKRKVAYFLNQTNEKRV